jgi:hypothetical protein
VLRRKLFYELRAIKGLSLPSVTLDEATGSAPKANPCQLTSSFSARELVIATDYLDILPSRIRSLVNRIASFAQLLVTTDVILDIKTVAFIQCRECLGSVATSPPILGSESPNEVNTSLRIAVSTAIQTQEILRTESHI